MNLNNKLQNVSKDTLIALIDYLSDHYDGIEEIVGAYLAENSEQRFTEKLTDMSQLRLAQQVENLTTSDRFFHYREAHILQAQCEQLVQGIAVLAEEHAEHALALLDLLLERHDRIFDRVDDSNGYIGDVLHDAGQLWLQIAARVREIKPEARNWIEVILGYYAANDYGCFDRLISDSRCLLSEAELYGLAKRFESDAQDALCRDTSGQYNAALSHASLGLQQVAKALQDLTLYERSVLIASPQPNSFQLEDVIRYALELENFARAEHWLQQPQWREEPRKHTDLKNLLLEKQGNIEQLKENLLSDWQSRPRLSTLRAYWLHANKSEQEKVTTELIARAGQLDDPEEVLTMLLFTDQVELAAHYLINQKDSLASSYYAVVLHWLDIFEEAGQTLAVIVCYRIVLMDVLDRGYSKAYRYAAGYFNALLALDKKTKPDYQGLESATAFIAKLQAKHGLKRSFWREAGYPAKGGSSK